MLAIDHAKSAGVAFDSDGVLMVTTIEGDIHFQYEQLVIIPERNEKIVIEKLVAFNARNISTLIPQAARYGYIVHSFEYLGHKVILIPPSTWRKKLGVKGKNGDEKKKYMQSEILRVTDVKVNKDEADAIGLWLVGMGLQIEDLKDWNLQKLKKITDKNGT